MRELFPGYYEPSKDELISLWNDCIFSFDASALLSLYQISPQASDTFLDILTELKGRIWLTYQAAFEYQKNRLNRIEQQIKLYDIENLTGPLKKHQNSLKNQKDHPLLQDDTVMSTLGECIKKLEAAFNDSNRIDLYLKSCEKLRDKIDTSFDAAIGHPYPGETYKEKITSAKLRFEEEIPPGYKDLEKAKGANPRSPYGDAIIWFQLLDLAKERSKPIIFITDDVKDDWWNRRDGKTTGPRPELVAEMKNFTQQKFYLYQSREFLRHAPNFITTIKASKNAVASAVQELYDIPQIEDESLTNEEEEAVRASKSDEIRDKLINALSLLTPRERDVLRLSFGLDDGRSRTLNEVGQLFGVSASRVREIKTKALRKLRQPRTTFAISEFLNEVDKAPDDF